MSTLIFPTLVGQGWSVMRTPEWATRKPVSVSGKMTPIADWSFPRYHWTLLFNTLRQGTFDGHVWTDFVNLFGFYNAMEGGFDSFLYTDGDDNTVTAQAIATGDGTTTLFQLQRTFGLGGNSKTDPIYAPNSVSAVYLNGVSQPGGNWSVSSWAAVSSGSKPGILSFTSAPALGVAITADMTYFFPCRFDDDKCEFEKFMSNRYKVKKLAFSSIK